MAEIAETRQLLSDDRTEAGSRGFSVGSRHIDATALSGVSVPMFKETDARENSEEDADVTRRFSD
ncbi:hypothetical protein [Ruegeria hyattellae]|jgi:hypothetical protein|uniref:hypothetical protein n=1 Tax=Ruegeria hyattellae TaxID=3233337 RepID=UPI00355BF768